MTLPVPDARARRQWVCATRIRERRHQLGLTQSQLATRLVGYGTALTNRALSAMENGRGLDLGRIPDLAAVLDCTVTYLLGLTDDPLRWEPDQPLSASGTSPHRLRGTVPGPGLPP